MRYLLIIAGEESASGPAVDVDVELPCASWTAQMESRGVLRSLLGLQPSSDATTVRVRGDEVLLTDGPFAETKDLIGGFALIECADLDEAIEVASKHPAARDGMIEVRPVRDR
jgi:hypothetical protein